MTRLLGILAVILAVIYLLLPSPAFPNPPPGALQSSEPADTESVYRRAYFTNLSRGEVMGYYSNLFSQKIPVRYTLNYPPEESAALIRDQTRTSWLEELVHPWRESLYINGFYPTKPTEQINISSKHYLNKITVRYIPSHPVTRLTVLGLCAAALYLLKKEYAQI